MLETRNLSETSVPAQPADALFQRVLVVITEDWFALSHFRPLLAQLRSLAREVVVATRSSGQLGEIEKLGVRPVDLDMRRGSFNPIGQAAAARSLSDLIDAERPDVVHAISLQPILLTSLAMRRSAHKPQAAVLHITGLGYIAASQTPKARLVRFLTFAIIRSSLPKSCVWLLAENPDDIALRLRAAWERLHVRRSFQAPALMPTSLARLPRPTTRCHASPMSAD
ncbi:MAG: glycosyltransferase [Hyphomicrobium sp.]